MKHTSRTRHINGTKPASSQVKTTDQKPVTVVFNSAETGKESFRVDFAEPEFAAIQRVCNQSHLNLEEFFQVAIGGHIANLEANPPVGIKTLSPETPSGDSDNKIVLAIFKDAVAYSSLELTEAVFEKLCNRARNSRSSLNEVLERAIARTLVNDGMNELEITCAKVRALLELMADKFDHIANRSGGEFEGDEVNRFCAGVGFLALDAKDQLTKSFKTVFHAAHAQLKEVAA